MNSSTPVLASSPSKPAEKLDKPEKALAGLLIVLGFVLIVGTLIWFGFSTDDGSLLSKELVTKEAAGSKDITEKNYADGVVTLALTLGAVLTLAGAFFGRIREIKFGGTVLVMAAPEEVTEKAVKKAEDMAKEKAPANKEQRAVALAKSIAIQQIGVAYATAPMHARSVIADSVGVAAADAAVKAVNR
jgi:hypothetical protein